MGLDRARAAELGSASLLELLAWVQAELDAGADAVSLVVLDPDFGRGSYPGERVEIAGRTWVHRPWRVWVELCDRLGLRLATPRPAPAPAVELRLERLGPAGAPDPDPRERYGAASEFARIRKAEEPSFVLDFADALARVGPLPRLGEDGGAPGRPARILSLGVNAGDELALLLALRPELAGAELVGVDHSRSALAIARARFPEPRHRFVEADLATLEALALGRFDLVLALDVLQSPGVDDRALLRALVQGPLARDAALILGLPNCRYRDGELLPGARMKNFSQPELSLLIADVAYYRRYLHQHRRKVFVTGRHEWLLTAVLERPGADR